MADFALLDVGVMFASIGVVGWLALKLRQSVIPFYIVLGVVLSPFVIGELIGYNIGYTEQSRFFIDLGAELGIVFLLFFLGLEFSLDRLLKSRKRIWKAGSLDLLNLLVGFIIGYLLLGNLVAAVLIGGIVYISSSAIITKSLIDMEWIANDESEPILGILVYEDLFIAIYLALITALLMGTNDVIDAAQDIGLAVGFILALLILVRYGEAFFEKLLSVSSNELTLLRAVGITSLVAGAALSIGVSEAVAAFFIGMAFSSTTHVESIEKLVSPIRDLFAAVFFFWIGLVTDPMLFLEVTLLILVAVLVTVPSKFVTGYLGAGFYEMGPRRSTRVGAALVTRGEFSLIIAAIAATAEGAFSGPLINETIPAFAVAYVLVMSIVGTTMMRYSDRIQALLHRQQT